MIVGGMGSLLPYIAGISNHAFVTNCTLIHHQEAKVKVGLKEWFIMPK